MQPSNTCLGTRWHTLVLRQGHCTSHIFLSMSFSLETNYTDRATATCWWNLVPTFVDRGVSRGQHVGSPTVVSLSLLDRSRYFSFKKLLIYPHKGWVDPVPDPLLLRKSSSAGNRTRGLWICSQEVWPLNHRGGLTYSSTRIYLSRLPLLRFHVLFLLCPIRVYLYNLHTYFLPLCCVYKRYNPCSTHAQQLSVGIIYVLNSFTI
jgi:hypothetical protein